MFVTLVVVVGAFGFARRAPAQDAAAAIRVVAVPAQQGRAREVLEIARRPLRLPGIGVVTAPRGTEIILAPDRAAFAAAAGGAAAEWAGGLALPERRLIVLPGWAAAREPGGSAATVRHELAHLALHDAVSAPIPRWFDEGYAELASGNWNADAAWTLRVAFALGRAPPLDSLALGWPNRAVDARFAYLLSATAVQFIAQRSGERGMRLLLRNWREQESIDIAVRTTFGATLGQIEEEWRASVRRRYGWLQALSSASAVWLLTLALLFAAWLPRRARNRRKLAEMRAEERMLPPPRADGVDVHYPLA